MLMCKRIISVLLMMLIVASPSSAKTKYYKRWRHYTSLDTVLLKVNYLKTYKECVDDQSHKTNICELVIGEEICRFQTSPYKYFRDHPPQEIIEKAHASEDSSTVYASYATKLLFSSKYDQEMGEQYFKNYPVPGITTVITKMTHPGSFYAYEEPLTKSEWQLEEGDSIVCGYSCAKATTTIRGRTWHVWYTLDIPFSEGPWKLCGLPGLILKATDSTGEFDFTAIAVEEEHSNYEEDNKVTVFNNELTMFTPQRYEQLLKLYYDNIIQYHTILIGAQKAEQLVQGQAKMGVPLKIEHKTPCLIEYYGKEKE